MLACRLFNWRSSNERRGRELADENCYRILNLLEANPRISQRELAANAGMSLGKVNYCLRAFIERGWIKVKNFTYSRNKRAYGYYLTTRGASEKARVTALFLKSKMDEFQKIKKQIEQLKREVALLSSAGRGMGVARRGLSHKE